MSESLSVAERTLIKRIVECCKKGKISIQFNLSPLPNPQKPGRLFLVDNSTNFRSNDFGGYQGTIDALVTKGFLQYVSKNTYYLTQASLDAFANNSRSQDVVSKPVKAQMSTKNEVLQQKVMKGCDMEALANHLVSISDLAFSTKSAFANCLSDTSAMSNPLTRQSIVQELPKDIRHSFSPGNNVKEDTLQIINACLRYSGGIAELIKVVHYFEGDTIPMAKLCQLLLSLSPNT